MFRTFSLALVHHHLLRLARGRKESQSQRESRESHGDIGVGWMNPSAKKGMNEEIACQSVTLWRAESMGSEISVGASKI